MLIRDIQGYIDAASGTMDIGVVVHSIETGEVLAVTYDIVVDISEYGELMVCISL